MLDLRKVSLLLERETFLSIAGDITLQTLNTPSLYTVYKDRLVVEVKITGTI